MQNSIQIRRILKQEIQKVDSAPLWIYKMYVAQQQHQKPLKIMGQSMKYISGDARF